MGNRPVLHFLLIVCLSAPIFLEHALAETKPISSGARFPNLIFEDSSPSKIQAYLGISQKNNFSFKDMSGTLFLFEVFNTYCTSCPKNVPILNNIYSVIENDLLLRGKVKVVGIAIGNNQNEVESFKREYKALYPILIDLHFTAHKALGNPRVPYTIFVKRDKGKAIVMNTHQGVIESLNTIMDQVRDLLKCNKTR